MRAGQGSRTGGVVCQGRAAAHERIAPGVFADPTALPMLRPDEREPVEQVRADAMPAGVAARVGYEMVKATAEVVVPRTVAIDRAVRAWAGSQVVILGAGWTAGPGDWPSSPPRPCTRSTTRPASRTSGTAPPS